MSVQESGNNMDRSQSQMVIPKNLSSVQSQDGFSRFSNPKLSQLYDHRKGLMASHYQSLMFKNRKFFDHVAGDDICGICNCGKCKCKKINLELDYRKGADSTYQQDFLGKDAKINKVRLPLEYYTKQYSCNQPMDINTINRNDFHEHKVNPFVMGKGQKEVEKFLPFSGYSSYQSTYINHPHNSLGPLKPPHNPTVIKDAKFQGKTSYNQNFVGIQVPRDPEYEKLFDINKRSFFKSPMNPDFPFLDETTNGVTYQPFKTKKNPNKAPLNIYKPLPGFEGQFTSTVRHDFTGKSAEKCPARKVLNTRYQEELMKLK